MDFLKYSRPPRATPSRWAHRGPIRRILFNYLNRLRKKLISALIYFISFFSILPTLSPRNQCNRAPLTSPSGSASRMIPPPSCLQIFGWLLCKIVAAADVMLSRCRHRRSIRAAAIALPPSRCAPPPRFALPPPPLTLPPPPCRRQASADVVLSRCRHHRRSAVALPPPSLTMSPPPCCRRAAANVPLSHCRHCRSLRAAST